MQIGPLNIAPRALMEEPFGQVEVKKSKSEWQNLIT